MRLKTLPSHNRLKNKPWNKPADGTSWGLRPEDCIEGALHHLRWHTPDDPRIPLLESAMDPQATEVETKVEKKRAKSTASSSSD